MTLRNYTLLAGLYGIIEVDYGIIENTSSGKPEVFCQPVS